MWILKATCHNPGHDWKDGHTRGEVKFAYSRTLPSPYAAGQHPVVGNTVAAVTADHFTFCPASILETARLVPAIYSDWRRRRRWSRRIV